MKKSRSIAVLSSLVVLITSTSTAAPRVEFELVTERGFPLTGAQEWSRLFSRFKDTGLTIRSAREGERERVQQTGTEQNPTYHVVGVLTRRNRLRLPRSGEFTSAELSRIEKWIEKLRITGIPRDKDTELAFGLSYQELVDFHQKLASPVTFSTKTARAGDVARRLVKELSIRYDVSLAARQAFSQNDAVADEFKGLSHGTALAAVLRPLGLACGPRRRTTGIDLIISKSGELTEWWPVGWPLQQPRFKAAPTLFEYLPVEIADFSLRKALDAIQPRVKIPFLFDHNALASQAIDLDQQLVSFPKRRSSYKKVLDVVLAQSQLKGAIMTDDAGQPFLWITTIKQ